MEGGKDKVTMARAMVIILFSFGTSANWHHHDDDDDNDDFAVSRYDTIQANFGDDDDAFTGF